MKNHLLKGVYLGRASGRDENNRVLTLSPSKNTVCRIRKAQCVRESPWQCLPDSSFYPPQDNNSKTVNLLSWGRSYIRLSLAFQTVTNRRPRNYRLYSSSSFHLQPVKGRTRRSRRESVTACKRDSSARRLHSQEGITSQEETVPSW
jgi:hypothetical protein